MKTYCATATYALSSIFAYSEPLGEVRAKIGCCGAVNRDCILYNFSCFCRIVFYNFVVFSEKFVFVVQFIFLKLQLFFKAMSRDCKIQFVSNLGFCFDFTQAIGAK